VHEWVLSCPEEGIFAMRERKEIVPAEKLRYEKPTLRSHGSVAELTKGGEVGTFLDRDFPTGTPFGELTFS
jgi:hypothetical protein